MGKTRAMGIWSSPPNFQIVMQKTATSHGTLPIEDPGSEANTLPDIFLTHVLLILKIVAQKQRNSSKDDSSLFS